MSLLGGFIIINKQKEEKPRRTAIFTLSPHSLSMSGFVKRKTIRSPTGSLKIGYKKKKKLILTKE